MIENLPVYMLTGALATFGFARFFHYKEDRARRMYVAAIGNDIDRVLFTKHHCPRARLLANLARNEHTKQNYNRAAMLIDVSLDELAEHGVFVDSDLHKNPNWRPV